MTEGHERLLALFKALANESRLRLLGFLAQREHSVQELADAIGVGEPTMSHHLAILREKGVLLTRKDANRVFYRVGDQRTLQLVGMMREVFCGVEN